MPVLRGDRHGGAELAQVDGDGSELTDVPMSAPSTSSRPSAAMSAASLGLVDVAELAQADDGVPGSWPLPCKNLR